MIQKSFFQKHHKRLVTEATLRAALWGLLVGSCASFLAAAVAWYFDFGGVLLTVAAGLGLGLVTGVVLYFAKFKPSVEELAYRVDRLGLEERMITMLQMQHDDSEMARLQRENAQQHLCDVEDKKLRMRLPKIVTTFAVVALVMAVGMNAVVALAESNILPPGAEIFDPEDPMAQYLEITYMAGEGGEIEGETNQLLLPGEDGLPVVAIPEDGWIFAGWDDGAKNPERQEKNVTSGALYTATFQPIGEEGDPGEGESQPGQQGNSGNEGDQAQDIPAGGDANTNTDNAGQAGSEGSGQGSDSSDEGGSKGEGQEGGEGKGDGKGEGAGGKWEDANKFLDGEQYYKEHLDYYYELAKQIFEENGEIPPELIEFFENYFNGI